MESSLCNKHMILFAEELIYRYKLCPVQLRFPLRQSGMQPVNSVTLYIYWLSECDIIVMYYLKWNLI